MSEKSYNDIESEIRQMADTYEAPFDEQAWTRMEALLDKDKGKKRRPFFWLWWMVPVLVAVSVAGSYFFMQQSADNKPIATGKLMTDSKTGDDMASTVNTDRENAPVRGTEVPDDNKQKQPGSETEVMQHVKPGVEEVLKTTQPVPGQKQSGVYLPIDEVVDKKVAGSTAVREKKKRKAGAGSKMRMKVEQPYDADASIADAGKKQVLLGVAETGEDKEDGKKEVQPVTGKKEVQAEQDITKTEIDSIAAKKISAPVTLNEKNTADTGKKEIAKTKKKSDRGFYFIAAAGAEASGVKLFSYDKLTARYGVGIGYQFTRNLSIQAGFYAGNKKYIAGPGDYKAKAGSYWSRVDITKVDAVCRVYEIPLLLRYDFSPGRNTNLYLSAGISSFIMKKEDYHYYYYRYGMPYDADAYYTGNNHLFSVLRVAPGLQRKLNGSFSLNVSPGIAIPLAGVGEGSVKLYSTDLTIGLKFTPKRKK